MGRVTKCTCADSEISNAPEIASDGLSPDSPIATTSGNYMDTKNGPQNYVGPKKFPRRKFRARVEKDTKSPEFDEIFGWWSKRRLKRWHWLKRRKKRCVKQHCRRMKDSRICTCLDSETSHGPESAANGLSSDSPTDGTGRTTGNDDIDDAILDQYTPITRYPKRKK